MKHVLIAFVRLWRALVSPLYGDVCKFYPSCSSYGLQSLQLHGTFKGSWLILRRLVRCHPWSIGGYDPVPGSPEERAWTLVTDSSEHHECTSSVCPSHPNDLLVMQTSHVTTLHEVNP